MNLKIRTNLSSLSAQRDLKNNRKYKIATLERISTGNRINKSSDDSAGLAISEKLRAETRSVTQAKRNTNDGISLIQTAEGAINEISNNLIRLRELSIQSASDTLGMKERSYANMEFVQLLSEIDRVSKTTRYNSHSLLDGTVKDFTIQVGAHNKKNIDQIGLELANRSTTIKNLKIDHLNVITKDSASENLLDLDKAIDKVNENRSLLGAMQTTLQSRMNALDERIINLNEANSNIRDADMAFETANLIKANILEGCTTTVLAQANVNFSQAEKLL